MKNALRRQTENKSPRKSRLGRRVGRFLELGKHANLTRRPKPKSKPEPSPKPHERIFVALDTKDMEQAKTWASAVRGRLGGVKLGLEFFNANGPQGVQAVQAELQNQSLFLDVKFHDIPNTVAGAIASVVPLGLGIVNVHALGGQKMMQSAVQSAMDTAKQHGIAQPLTIAVTILTSMDDTDLRGIGFDNTPQSQAVHLAKLAQDSGMDGVVCSAHEISPIRKACGDDFQLIVPGIRPAWAESGDQKRIMTPRDAINAGADYLVMGRPITQAPDIHQAIDWVVDEISN